MCRAEAHARQPKPIERQSAKGPYVIHTARVRLASDLREIFQEQIAYRELLLRITHRDLLLRYKQTIMGAGWAIFMPLLNTAVFSIIFTRVAPIDAGMPYPLYA